jgi:hypothetical protein
MTKNCDYCKKQFQTNRDIQRFCSPDCNADNKQKYRNDRQKQKRLLQKEGELCEPNK